MIQKLKAIFITGLLSFSTVGAPLIPATVAVAQNNTEKGLCQGSQLDLNANCDQGVASDASKNNINTLVTTAINIFSWVIGIISVVMIMVGGVKYITSQGSSDDVTTAKNTILYAIIGLIIVALAQVIVRFVLGTANSVDNVT